MKIIKLDSRLITIVDHEEIPYLNLLHESSLDQFRKKFKFNNIEIRQENPSHPPTISCDIGKISIGTRDIIIENILVQQRKINLAVNSNDSDAQIVLDRLYEFFSELSGEEITFTPIVKTHESLIICSLDVFAKDIIHPNLLEFISDDVISEANNDDATVSNNFFTLKFRLDYFVTNEKLKEYRIDLSPKEFYISPRDGQPLEEQIYISEAPLKTEDHIELIQRFEKVFS